MATPTRSQAVSTPKSHLSNTPGRPMASPRPGTSSVAQKSLAYKSPAVKTPASTHGHAHNISVSSHPSSTPLAANAIRDELLNLDSPAAALINSIASGQEGLGIVTHPPGTPARDEPAARSPEAEKVHRLEQAVNALRSKMVGRGISREGVERIARVQGFEALWDEDNLTVAGNIVELDITFDSLHRDKVVDIVLKLNTVDGISRTQQDATGILRAQIGVDASLPDNLQELSVNLQYLAQMDRINVTPTAFEVVGRLYETFRNIWEEERKRIRWRKETHHLCGGSIGRPNIDQRSRLGVCVDYWRDLHEISSMEAEVETQTTTSQTSTIGLKQARFSCAPGEPSISSALKWLTPNPLGDSQPEDMLDSDDAVRMPAWLDPTSTIDSVTADLEEDMSIDQGLVKPSKTLNVHFICDLDPNILVPLNTVHSLNTQQPIIHMDQAKLVSYSRALQTARNAVVDAPRDEIIERRWSRRLFSRSGSTIEHSYALYSAVQNAELWFYPVAQFAFNHPRQLANAIPVLRQYAVVWALMRNLVVEPVPAAQSTLDVTTTKRTVTKRSNAKSAKANPIKFTTKSTQDGMSVDISLDVISDPNTCKLEIFTAIPGTPSLKKGAAFLHFSITVRPNGLIDVLELSGIPETDTTTLRSKLSRMLSATEDIGMVLEWLVERATVKREPSS